MANNDRALLKVLDLRKSEEEQALEFYQHALGAVANHEEGIKKIIEFRENYISDMSKKGATSNFDALQYAAYQSFIEKLYKIEKKQIQELEMLKRDAERKRLFYLEKQKRRKIIESLLEKHKQQRIKAELVAEQKLLDEYVVSMTARRNSNY